MWHAPLRDAHARTVLFAWQPATQTATPCPPAVSSVAQVAAEATASAKSAIFLSPFFLRLLSTAVTVWRAARSSAAGLSLMSAFILHGECCGGSGCRTGREIEFNYSMITACISLL